MRRHQVAREPDERVGRVPLLQLRLVARHAHLHAHPHAHRVELHLLQVELERLPPAHLPPRQVGRLGAIGRQPLGELGGGAPRLGLEEQRLCLELQRVAQPQQPRHRVLLELQLEWLQRRPHVLQRHHVLPRMRVRHRNV